MKRFKMFVILNVQAESYWQARDITWSLVSEKMKPVVVNVVGSEFMSKGWWGNLKSQLTGK